MKIQKFDDECKRYKNELASLEADIIFVKDQCARELKDYKRERAIVDALKKKSNEVTDKVTELCMKLVSSITLVTTSVYFRFINPLIICTSLLSSTLIVYLRQTNC